jgi:phage tail-like protein
MAVERPSPYGSFNFQVDLGSDPTAPHAGFQEVTGMNVEVTSAEYRACNSPNNHPIKINGVYKVGDVTFKRGLIGATDLYNMMDAIRTGDRSAIIPVVTVTLQDEAHNKVFTWKLSNARPLKYNAPALNAKTGTEVAIEELVLSIEDFTIE